jgi:anti-sigma B factor antagonist
MADKEEAPRLLTESLGGCLVIRLKTKVLEERDLSLASDYIAPAGPHSGVKAVVLDFAAVQFVPSLALGLLMKMNEACKKRDQELRFAAVTPQVRDVLKITRLDRVLHLFDTVEAAAK